MSLKVKLSGIWPRLLWVTMIVLSPLLLLLSPFLLLLWILWAVISRKSFQLQRSLPGIAELKAMLLRQKQSDVNVTARNIWRRRINLAALTAYTIIGSYLLLCVIFPKRIPDLSDGTLHHIFKTRNVELQKELIRLYKEKCLPNQVFPKDPPKQLTFKDVMKNFVQEDAYSNMKAAYDAMKKNYGADMSDDDYRFHFGLQAHSPNQVYDYLAEQDAFFVRIQYILKSKYPNKILPYSVKRYLHGDEVYNEIRIVNTMYGALKLRLAYCLATGNLKESIATINDILRLYYKLSEDECGSYQGSARRIRSDLIELMGMYARTGDRQLMSLSCPTL